MDEVDSIEFRLQLLMVDEDLGKEDVEAVKFLCQDFIPFSKLEVMTSAREIFQFLISQDIVNREEPFVIAELLYRIRRLSLLQKFGYTKEEVLENLPLKGKVLEYRQMLYELSEEFTEDDLRCAVFLLRSHLPKVQPKMSCLQLLTVLEKKDLLSETNLQMLKELCTKIAPNLLNIISKYEQKKVSTSVQESEKTAPSSVREFRKPSGSDSLSAPIKEGAIKYPTKSLDFCSSLTVHVGNTHSFGSNPDVKAENFIGHPEHNFPCREQDEESKTALEMPSLYKMDGPCRGRCLIFNNINFKEHLGKRMGSQKDAEELERVFKWLGLEVITYDDQSSVEMLQHLQKWQSSENWKESDCLVCCILSHGESGKIYGTDARLIPIRDIMSHFTAKRCPLLATKPKLFFIQACQGEKTQKAVYLEPDAYDWDHLGADAQSAGPLSSPQMPSIPEEADFLLGMATVDGYLSFRHIQEGTWYIQALCTKLQLLVPRGEDILSILTQVNDDVSRRADSQGLKKQMPQPAYTLTKKLVFPVPRDPPPSQQP